MTSPGLLNWLRISFIAIIWGGAFMFVRIALGDFPPLTLAAGRILIGAVSLYILMRLRGISLPTFHDSRLWRYILSVSYTHLTLPTILRV